MDGGARLGQFKRASMPCEYALSLAHRLSLAADVHRPPPPPRAAASRERTSMTWTAVGPLFCSHACRTPPAPITSHCAVGMQKFRLLENWFGRATGPQQLISFN